MTQPTTAEQRLHNRDLLTQASKSGNLEEVKRLIPLSTIKELNAALGWAAIKGHTEIVELLIPASDPKEGLALQMAARYGHTETLKLLLPVSDPKANNSQALRIAAQEGHLDIVKLLLPVSEPKAQGSYALRLAAQEGHIECVTLLLPVSDYQLVVKKLLDENKDVALLQQCIDEYESLQQKERLTIQVDKVVENANCSVKRKM